MPYIDCVLRMLFLLFTRVATYSQCLWKAREVSRWIPSSSVMRANSSSHSTIMILGWPLVCLGSDLKSVTVDS